MESQHFHKRIPRNENLASVRTRTEVQATALFEDNKRFEQERFWLWNNFGRSTKEKIETIKLRQWIETQIIIFADLSLMRLFESIHLRNREGCSPSIF